MNKTVKTITITTCCSLAAALVIGATNQTIKAFRDKANANDVYKAVEILKESQDKDRKLIKQEIEAERKLSEERNQQREREIDQILVTQQILLKELIGIKNR
jgi:altronate dehydratase